MAKSINLFLSSLLICVPIAIYIFNLKLTFMPIPLNLFLGVLGTFLFFMNYGLQIPKKFFTLAIYFSLIIISFSFSFLINQKGDFYYLNEVFIYNLVFFFSCYFIKYLFGLCNVDYNIKNITIILSLVVAAQLLVSLLAYINSSFFNLVFSIFDMNLAADSLESFNQGRMVGVGAAFFASGIINSLLLVLLSFVLVTNKNKNITPLLILLLIIIGVIGLLSSRTTIIGIIISMIYLAFKKPLLIFYSSSIGFALLIVLNFLFSDSRFFELWTFGTDFISDYDNSQAGESTSVLQDMLRILPNSYSTWIYGDSFFRNIYGGYYKFTDVGYLRIIFCNGIIGLFLYLGLIAYLILKSFSRNKGLAVMVGSLFLILMIKGFVNLTPFLFLFFLVDYNVLDKK
jgi:oligosaccharide repeat unit polymerase